MGNGRDLRGSRWWGGAPRLPLYQSRGRRRRRVGVSTEGPMRGKVFRTSLFSWAEDGRRPRRGRPRWEGGQGGETRPASAARCPPPAHRAVLRSFLSDKERSVEAEKRRVDAACAGWGGPRPASGLGARRKEGRKERKKEGRKCILRDPRWARCGGGRGDK